MSGRSVKHGMRIVEVPSAPLDPASKKHKEDIDKIQQDITVLSQRIAEAKGELPAIGSAAITRLPDMSSVTSSARGLNDSEKRVRDMKEMKLSTLEQLLERIAEYDRIILSKTIPETAQNQRRKSFCSDLFMLPTHLRVIDRLLDVHTRSQRVTVIKTTVNGGSKPPTPSNIHEEGVKLPQIVNLSQGPDKITQQHEQQIEQLNDKIDQAERRYRFSEQQYQDLRLTHSTLEKEHQAFRDKMNQMERDHSNALQLAKDEATKAATAAATQQLQQSTHQQTSQQVHILQQQVQSLQEQLKQREMDVSEKDSLLQKKEVFFQSQVKHWQDQEQKYLMEQHEAQTSVSHSEEQYQSLLQQYKQVESRLDIEIQDNSKYIHRLQALISSIQYFHANTSAMTSPQKPSRSSTQPPPATGSTGNQEADKLFLQIDSLLGQYHQNIQSEYSLLLSVKDVLENEVQSHVVQKDMIQSDFTILQENYDALKAAYHSLSYETATGTKTNPGGGKGELQKEVDTLKAQVQSQTKQLADTHITVNKQSIDLRDQLSLIKSLESQITSLQIKEISTHTTLLTQADEIDSLKAMVEKYKQKIKDLSAAAGNTSKKDRDFFDTFEEVMQDEMMSMKSAFEKKLKAAKEEADQKTKLHQQEILKMQQLSNSASGASLLMKRF